MKLMQSEKKSIWDAKNELIFSHNNFLFVISKVSVHDFSCLLLQKKSVSCVWWAIDEMYGE